jgi:8-oxo-dGTP diphosphatase
MTRRVLAASGVVRDQQGRFLLVLRANDPEAGRWTVPGGRVDAGETLQQAAAREVVEETGLDCEILHELWSLDVAHGDVVYEIHDFLARPVGGELRAGDDAADAGWFTPDEMARMPLTSDLLGYLGRAGLLPDEVSSIWMDR